MPKKHKRTDHLTDHDCILIDDIRKALKKTVFETAGGSFFDGSTFAAQAGFEKAVAQIVIKRSGMVKS